MADQDFAGSADRLYVKEATIANGGHTSAAVNVAGFRIAGIRMPSAWTAADIAFSESPDGTETYLSVFDDSGAQVLVTVAASSSVRLDEGLLAPYRSIKVRSVTAGTGVSTVAQGAERVIDLYCVPTGTR
jgi:hypothetical protein